MEVRDDRLGAPELILRQPRELVSQRSGKGLEPLPPAVAADPPPELGQRHRPHQPGVIVEVGGALLEPVRHLVQGRRIGMPEQFVADPPAGRL